MDSAATQQELSGTSLARHERLQTVVVPQLRAIGFLAVAILCGLHHALISADTTDAGLLVFLASTAAYNLVSWLILKLFYSSSKTFDLGQVFLHTDLLMWAWAIYVTGSEKSWLVFALMLRAADQAPNGFRVVVRYAHLGPAVYVALLLYLYFGEHRALNWSAEAVKVAGLYFANVYISATALVHGRTRRQMRKAREEIEQLRRKTFDEELQRRRTAAIRETRAASWGARMVASLGRIETAALRLTEGSTSNTPERAVAEIRESVAEALIALDKVLAVRPSASQTRVFDPLQLMQQCVAAVQARAAQSGVRLDFQPGPNLPPTVLGDPGFYGWVLGSLLEEVLEAEGTGAAILQMDASSSPDAGSFLVFTLTGASSQASLSPPAGRLIRQSGGKFRADADPGRGVRYSWTLSFEPTAAGDVHFPGGDSGAGLSSEHPLMPELSDKA